MAALKTAECRRCKQSSNLVQYLEILGITSDRIIEFPLVRQPGFRTSGPSFFLNEVIYVSEKRREHAGLGKQALHLRFLLAGLRPDLLQSHKRIIVINRSGALRRVRNHDEIVHAIKSSRDFRNYEVVEFLGTSSVLKQMELFRTAAAVIGPHGAGLSNIIHCKDKTVVIEYVKRKGCANSPLYARISSLFNLNYWNAIDEARRDTCGGHDEYVMVPPAVVVATLQIGLQEQSNTSYNNGAISIPDAPMVIRYKRMF